TFMPGPVGVFYRQFALTMAMSIVISGVVALSLTPVLCAMILKPASKTAPKTGFVAWINRSINKLPGRWATVVRSSMCLALGTATGAVIYSILHLHLIHQVVSEQMQIDDRMVWLATTFTTMFAAASFRAISSGSDGGSQSRSPIAFLLHCFDQGIEKITGGYAGLLNLIITRRTLTVAVVSAFGYGILIMNQVLPSGFIPLEDQGMIYGIVQTPPGSTLEYTNDKCHELQSICAQMNEITSVSSIAGYEILTEGRGSNAGTCIINLKPWAARQLTSKQIIESLEERGSNIANVKLEFFEPPAIPGFGAAGGFSVNLLDKTNSGDYEALGEQTDRFMEALGRRPELKGLFTFFAANYPQYEVIIDNDAAMQKGVSIRDALDNLSIVVGSTWEQGFVRFGQFYKVYVQAAPEFRRYPRDLDNMYVKNETGDMVPYSAFMRIEKKQGLNEISRYNLYPTAPIQGAPAAGYSSGEAIAAIKEVAAETLPNGFDIDWRGLAYDEAKAGNTGAYLFGIVVVFVYFVLVGQYESFILPLTVIASLPVGIFGSFLLLDIMGLSNDVYCQIGLVMLVGLLGKNAILIIEFAVQRRQDGLDLKDAGIEGGRLRFRPILMTSFAFIAGLIPLVRATGPGAIGNRTIGTTAVGGMLMGTVIGVIVIPGLYFLFAKLADGRKLIRDESETPLSETFES
ncbi:MAG: efflux RND transporter permease subunit, partial [Fuerstiella sp.]